MRAPRPLRPTGLLLPLCLLLAAIAPAARSDDAPPAGQPGPEIEAAFNQPPPDVRIRTAFDLGTINVDRSLRAFLSANASLLGGIAPQRLTVAAALSAAKDLVAASPNQVALANVRARPEFQSLAALGNLSLIAVVNHSPMFAMGVLLLADEKFPADPKVRFNLAGLLAQHGSVNEAEALLDDLYARRALPEHPFGITALQGADYLRAYIWMRQGRTKEAAALLRPIVAANPAFAEADLTFALLEWKLGEDAQQPYLMGVWRRPVKTGTTGTTGTADKTPGGGTAAKGGDDVEKPNLRDYGLDADLFVDLSRGKPGVLPAIQQPVELADRIHFLVTAQKDIAELNEQVAALAKVRQDAYDRSAKKQLPEQVRKRLHDLDRIIDVENARMSELRTLKRNVDKLERDQTETFSRLSLEFATARLAIIGDPAKKEEQQCEEIRVLVEKFDTTMRANVQGTDYAVRRLERYWHQYATALGSLTSDPDYREYLAACIKMDDRVGTVHVLANMMQSCTFASYAEACAKPKPKTANALANIDDPELAHCSEENAKKSFGVEGGTQMANPIHAEPIDVDLGIEFSCEGFSIEAGTKVMGIIGVSAEVEFKLDGTCTVFVGPKGELGSESLKEGAYITVDKNSIKDVGVRAVEKNTTKFGMDGAALTASYTRADSGTRGSFFPGPDVPARNASGMLIYVPPKR